MQRYSPGLARLSTKTHRVLPKVKGQSHGFGRQMLCTSAIIHCRHHKINRYTCTHSYEAIATSSHVTLFLTDHKLVSLTVDSTLSQPISGQVIHRCSVERSTTADDLIVAVGNHMILQA